MFSESWQFNIIFLNVKINVLKARSNMIQHCLMVLDGVRSVLNSVGCWSLQTNPTPSNNVGCQYRVRNYGVLLITRAKMLVDVGWKAWTKLNFIQHRPTPSNMFDGVVQSGQTYCVRQCLIMFDQHAWSVWTGLIVTFGILPFQKQL